MLTKNVGIAYFELKQLMIAPLTLITVFVAVLG